MRQALCFRYTGYVGRITSDQPFNIRSHCLLNTYIKIKMGCVGEKQSIGKRSLDMQIMLIAHLYSELIC